MSEPSDVELVARLRTADPAASLPTVPPEGVARLLEDTMSHDVLTETAHAPAPGHSRLPWLVAAAATVVIAGAGAFVVLGGDDPSSQKPPAASEPTVTELHAPGSTPARCMVPNAEVLAGQAVAFDGTVSSIGGDVVTLTATEWYAGSPTDTVTVSAPGETLAMLLSAVQFEDGQRYLVAADQSGDVVVCGFSAAWSKPLERLYVEAFPS